jgi:hypothetical protein
MTQLEIVNLALSRLGDRKQLANLSGSDPVTLAILSTYPVARDVLLASFPWPFATTTVELLDAPESYPLWAYAYVHPASALRVLRVFNENTKEGLSEDFKVQATASASGRRILAGISPAYCEYIVAVTDESVFPTLFSDTFAWFLASELAIPLSTDPELQGALEKIYMNRLANATTMAARERSITLPKSSRYAEARR